MPDTAYQMPSFIGESFIPQTVVNGLNQFWETFKSAAVPGRYGCSSGTELDLDVKDSIELDVPQVFWEHPAIAAYLGALNSCLLKYKEEYKFCSEGQRAWGIVQPLVILDYPPNGGFKIYHAERTGVKGDTMLRHLSFMTYLSDVPEEDGGGTEYFYQGRTYPCKSGLTLISPASWTHVHRGIVTKNHPKRIIVGCYSYI